MILEGARTDGGTSALAGAAPQEVSFGALSDPLPCSGTLEVLQEMKLLPWPGLAEGTVAFLSQFSRNWGIGCNSFEPMPALVVAFQPL